MTDYLGLRLIKTFLTSFPEKLRAKSPDYSDMPENCFIDPMSFSHGGNLISALFSHKLKYKFIFIHIPISDGEPDFPKNST